MQVFELNSVIKVFIKKIYIETLNKALTKRDYKNLFYENKGKNKISTGLRLERLVLRL